MVPEQALKFVEKEAIDSGLALAVARKFSDLAGLADRPLGASTGAALAGTIGKDTSAASPFINRGASAFESAAKQTNQLLGRVPAAGAMETRLLSYRTQQAELQNAPISDVQSLELQLNPNVFRGTLQAADGRLRPVIIHTPSPEPGSGEFDRFKEEHAIQEMSPFLFGTVPAKVFRPVEIAGVKIAAAMVQPEVGEGMAAALRRLGGEAPQKWDAFIDRGEVVPGNELRAVSYRLNELGGETHLDRAVDAAAIERLAISSDHHLGNWRAVVKDDRLAKVYNLDNQLPKGSVPKWSGDDTDYYYGWSGLPLLKAHLLALQRFQAVVDTKLGRNWMRSLSISEKDIDDTISRVAFLSRGKYPALNILNGD